MLIHKRIHISKNFCEVFVGNAVHKTEAYIYKIVKSEVQAKKIGIGKAKELLVGPADTPLSRAVLVHCYKTRDPNQIKLNT